MSQSDPILIAAAVAVVTTWISAAGTVLIAVLQIKAMRQVEFNTSSLQSIAAVGRTTHKIVNHNAVIQLRLVAALRQRIALENPLDADAMEAAVAATAEADRAEHAERLLSAGP